MPQPQSESVAILLINEIAEEIKLTTLSFRGFFPNCRVEAVYSLEEALQWANRTSWQLILLDDRLLAQRAASIFPELKQLAPSATIVLQTERSDSTSAVNALQAGADFLLYKKSPAFLTELMLYAKNAIETQTLRRAFELTQARHDRLIDTLADVFYELDAEGQFRYLSPLVAPLLGYTQDELIGAPYSTIVSPDYLDRVRHCFNDRRTGARASHRIEVTLLRKSTANGPALTHMRAEISAKGLYDAQRRYLGTVGLLRDISELRRQEDTIRHLEHRLLESDRLLTLARRVAALSNDLRVRHAAIQEKSRHLLRTIHESRLTEQAESLLVETAEAAHLADELTLATTEPLTRRNTVNDILETILAAAQSPLLNTDQIERFYAPNLPPFTGDLDALTQLLGMLLSHAQRYVAAVGSRHRLRISTTLIGPYGTPIHPGLALSPPVAPIEVAIQIQEIDALTTAQDFPIQAIGNLFDAYAFIKQLGGRWDFRAPVGGLLSINVWIPLEQTPHPAKTPIPPPPPLNLEHALIEQPPLTQVSTTAPPRPSPSAFPIPASQPLPDRRKNIRTATNLPARLTVGNTLYSGTLTELSSTGATLEVEGLLPSLEYHSASVVLKTAASQLELHGMAHDRGGSLPQAAAERQTSRLAFLFIALDDTEHAVLVSLIEEARALALTVEVLLSPPRKTADLADPATENVLRGTDHRETVRVRVSLPVRITAPSIKTGAGQTLGRAVNLSRGGVCLQTESCVEMTQDIVALHFSSYSAFDPPRGHEPEAPEAILSGRIVHITSNHTVLSESKPGSSPTGQLVGIRFEQLTPFAERDINRVIAQHTGSSMDLAGTTGWSSIVSTRRECRNARNQMIAVTDDHARHQISPNAPIVLIVPGFGLTQTDYAPLSFSLAANGFRILRYDHTNHVGQSDGDILQVTLRSIQSDLQSVLDFVRATWPSAPLTLFAEDIAARVALKTLAKNNPDAHLLLLNPVLSIEGALSAVYAPDAIGNYRQGVRRGVVNLWGLNVNFDQFVGDAIAGNYADVASSAADFARLTTPPILLTSPGSHRPLDNMFGPQLDMFSAMGSVPVIVPLEADVSGNSSAYDERHAAAFRTILKLISAPLTGNSLSLQMHEPNIRAVRQQQQLEQERVRLRHHVSQATRSALWIAHLAQLPQLGHQPDYWRLENDLYRRLLPMEPGMAVLDIGCGEGDLARIILTDQIYRSMYKSGLPDGPFSYIGADYSRESLDHTEQQVHAFAQKLPFQIATGLSADQFLKTSWLHIDWHSPLPLPEGSIQRILCHLSLSFSPSPLYSLRKMLRVLHPDGRAVITVLQPHTDLTTLFHRHLRASAEDQFGTSAQILLHHLGRLREAVRHGLLHSYERNELTRLLVHAGADPIQVVPTLDNQVLLAVIRKGKSSG